MQGVLALLCVSCEILLYVLLHVLLHKIGWFRSLHYPPTYCAQLTTCDGRIGQQLHGFQHWQLIDTRVILVIYFSPLLGGRMFLYEDT